MLVKENFTRLEETWEKEGINEGQPFRVGKLIKVGSSSFKDPFYFRCVETTGKGEI